MWWTIAPQWRGEFQHWHSHEHFPERLGLPGFRRASRWAATGDAASSDGFFVLYELERFDSLTSPAYLERLNNPTPWSVRMMPHHQGMVRSQSHVLESSGSLLGGTLATVRMSPQPGREEALRQELRHALGRLAGEPGLTGGHLLRTDTPAIAMTREQAIRGGDRAADWIVLLGGCSEQALRAALGELPLNAAASDRTVSLFRLDHSMSAADLAP